MNPLQEFIGFLSGEFDNKEQLHRLEQEGVTGYPYARHVNTVCNSKITGLPENFDGIFLLEESYYTTGDVTKAMPHLFLFTQEGDKIKLTSYEMPAGYTKEDFSFANLKEIPYDSLEVSGKFTPALYEKKGDWWEGGSVSHFSPVLKFTLFERFSAQVLEVSESMEVNGKRTFGYDKPLEYRRMA